jgi:hypothetical protein
VLAAGGGGILLGAAVVAPGLTVLAMEFTYLFTLRQGRVITIQMYWDHAEAS